MRKPEAPAGPSEGAEPMVLLSIEMAVPPFAEAKASVNLRGRTAGGSVLRFLALAGLLRGPSEGHIETRAELGQEAGNLVVVAVGFRALGVGNPQGGQDRLPVLVDGTGRRFEENLDKDFLGADFRAHPAERAFNLPQVLCKVVVHAAPARLAAPSRVGFKDQAAGNEPRAIR
jgi:hypothetical protein